MSQVYLYTRLQTHDSIRVMSLLPSPDQKAPLRCELIEVSLISSPQFEALSYCWGSPLRDRPVLCDGQQLLITANCEAALYSLRNRKESRILWIDSICIDQSFILERNHQVKLMMQIYSSAKCVLVWLGPRNPDINLAFKYLSKTAKNMEHNLSIAFESKQKYDEVITRLAIKRIKKENEHRFGKLETHRSILESIHQNPWFTRMWTLQEVAVAERVIILCGNRQLPWESFQNAHIPLINHISSTKISNVAAYSMDTVPHITLYFFFRIMMKTPLHERQIITERELPSLLLDNFEKQATNPKDKAFALYGCLKAIGIIPPDPNYAKSTGVVYREMAKAIMTHCKNLDLLFLASGVHSIPDLPSWVPNWTRRRHGAEHFTYGEYFFKLPVTQDSIGSFHFSEDGSRLVARGVIVDSIALCEGPAPEDTSDDSIKHLFSSVCTLRRWLLTLEKAKILDVYVDGTNVFGAFIDTVFPTVGEDELKEILNPARRRAVIQKWVEILMGTATCCSHDVFSKHTGEIFDAGTKEWSGKDEEFSMKRMLEAPEFIIMSHLIQHFDVAALHKYLAETALRFLFYITQNGYIGKGDIEIQTGDVVAVIPGFKYAVFLRPTHGGHLFVGLGMIQHEIGLDYWLSDESKLVDVTIL